MFGLLPTRVASLIETLSSDRVEHRQMGARTMEGEEHLRLVLETAQEAFISIDDRGMITAWNPEAELTFGWPAEEAIGRRLSDAIIPTRHREAHERGLSHFLATGEGPVLGKRIEIEALHRDGHEFPIELTISPLNLGERYVFNAFLRDISERRRSEALLAAQHAVTRVLAECSSIEEAMPRLLETLCEHMSWQRGGFWTVDEDARVLRCETLWRSRSVTEGDFDAISRELTFRPGVGLPGRVWSSGKRAWIEDVTGDSNFPRARFAAKEGLHAAVGLPIEVKGEVVSVVEFFTDEIKPPDQALTKMLATISSQIGQFVERRVAEQEADRMKNEFFASVSHELRTPLTSILGYTDLLLAGQAGELNEQQRQFLEVTDRNAKRQLRLVGDLLFVSQVEAGKFEIQIGTVDIGAVAGNAVEASRPVAVAKGIELALVGECEPSCNGDQDRLAQLLDNLVSNALKFTPDGGRVELRLSAHDGRAVIEVGNTGSYIAPEEREQLFDRFFRASSASEQSVPGIGLGLTISKAIVVAHGGLIQVDSERHNGTTFRVELPLREPELVDLDPHRRDKAGSSV